MYVERIPNRNSPPAILLRESYRDGNKFRRRTLANLSHWPPARIEALRCVLRDEAVAPAEQDALTLLRSLPHGHVAAALGTLRKIGLDRVLSQGGMQPRREVALCIAMIVARLIDPASKLATARGLADDTATSSLGQVLGLGRVDEQELYEALDWLVGQQQRIERALARRHLLSGARSLEARGRRRAAARDRAFLQRRSLDDQSAHGASRCRGLIDRGLGGGNKRGLSLGCSGEMHSYQNASDRN